MNWKHRKFTAASDSSLDEEEEEKEVTDVQGKKEEQELGINRRSLRFSPVKQKSNDAKEARTPSRPSHSMPLRKRTLADLVGPLATRRCLQY
jgi:hypothetical protein